VSVCYEPGSTEWVPGRGDYGTEYATDLVEIIERHNCVKGCTRSGTQAERDEFGLGGNCEVLARVCVPAAVPELDPRPDGPHCRVREDPATAGMDPLFPEVTG
jgi:hypothetical protein